MLKRIGGGGVVGGVWFKKNINGKVLGFDFGFRLIFKSNTQGASGEPVGLGQVGLGSG